MDETAAINEAFAIITEAEPAGVSRRVLKHGETFGVFDQCGNIMADEAGEEGLYHDGTRFLSRLELLLFRRRPLLLSSTISRDNAVFVADVTNPDLLRDGAVVIQRGEIHVARSRVLLAAQCAERIRVTNYALHPIDVPVTVRFDADFKDVFEVRGTRRPRPGERLPDVPGHDYQMRYLGVDGVERATRLRCAPGTWIQYG